MARIGPPPPAPRLEHPGVRMVAVIAGFHRDLSERLLQGTADRLREAGLPDGHLEEAWVPGAFELPLAARSMALRRRYAAVIALGVVIRGETAHFDHICSAASHGLMRVGLETGVPCTFGLLTTEDRPQAEARSGGDKGNAGSDAADAAVVMANLVAEGR
ncbi:6,7-dimethyl-8-ribityllumazine synthase [Miltoncostaea oceani]|jgi:6,7-dimethyl-8-ribityllumazine synthase|uniref:6,7-dimethyl-8-ribityllumazine synthase n=1 Tax=Miltoncostaea oceani TaxID=2843216 RepID=UPI001C3D95DC|nr:6,7-dimethyl-8-ribityllumazine synthase [Miltoncostaea oceani]